jgi:hypothetical protein
MLFMDYVPIRKIASTMSQIYGATNTPRAETVKKWASKGEGVNGTSWFHIREITDQARGKASSDIVRRHYDRSKGGPSAYIDWAESTMVDLEIAQGRIMHGIHSGSTPVKLGDLPNLVKTRQLLEGMATARIEHSAKHTEVLGKIIYQSANQVISDHGADPAIGQVMKALLDLVAGEFTRFLAFGGKPEDYEIEAGRAVNVRLIQSRDTRRGESTGRNRPLHSGEAPGGEGDDHSEESLAEGDTEE